MKKNMLSPNTFRARAGKIMLGLLATFLVIVSLSSTFAQNVMLAPVSGFQLFAGGGGYQGVYTNIQIQASLSGDFTTIPNPVTLSASGVPAGVAVTFTANGFTNSQSKDFLWVAVTNVAKGTYSLTITASTNGVQVGNSIVIPLIVGTLWTGSGADLNWTTTGNWTANAPSADDDVMFQDASVNSNSNNVNGSITIGSLSFIRNISGTSQYMTMDPGTTLSVVGSNGLAINEDSYPGNSKTMKVYISGAGSKLLVTNDAANIAINGISSGSSATTLTMSELDNFEADVNRFGVADVNFALQGAVGVQIARVDFAKTNLIRASHVGNYSADTYLDYGISCFYNSDSYNNGSSQIINLGMQNIFEADSIGFAQGRMGGSSSATTFNSLFAGSSPSVSFRNSDGVSRMSLVAVAVDAGTNQTGSNTKFNLNLVNGYVDMLVDQMWIGRNRLTNNANANPLGKFAFDDGIVDVNTLRLGYQAYTNNSHCNGTVTVGGNATNSALLKVNTELSLGFTSGDYAGGAEAAKGYGQLIINTNGMVQANTVTVGQLSANNLITINNGGILTISNTMANLTNRLGTLTVNGGGNLTLNMSGTNTLVFVTNLVANSGIINIASIAGSSSFAPIISYMPGFGESASFVAGSIPTGKNATLFNNTTTHTIDLTLSSGTPKTLLWQGYVDNNWDNSTKNWLDLNTGVHTNFATGDSVIFDDTASFANVNVAEDVVPRQSAGINGITMTNNTLVYVFSGPGGIRGAAAFLKMGVNSVEVDNYAEVVVRVSQGLLTGGGTIGAANIASGAMFSFGGTVLGGVTCAGTAVNSGTVSGALSILGGGIVTNTATVNGALSLQNGGFLCNSGTFANIGTSTTDTNTTLINAGTIYGTTLTINGALIDAVPGAAAVGPGSINLGTLTINGTFVPGGDAVQTTTVTDYGADGNQRGNPNGRVQLNTGSMTIFKVNSTNAQPYTKLLSQNQGFGPSQTAKAINGCTLVITNVGPTPFTAGQTFKLFGQYYNDGSINNAGLNTTNAYPIILPASPGPGLVWDMSQLIPGGTIGVISASSIQITLTNRMTFIGTNLVTELSWPADYIGSGWVQQQVTSLTNGLGTNWASVGASYGVSDILLTNTINANSAVFYRFVRP